MSDHVEETAILGLRAQILDNIRLYKDDLIIEDIKDIILTTVCKSGAWTAVVYGKSGNPLCSTRGHDETAVAALRNMLKHTSERIAVSNFFDQYLNKAERHDTTTSAGIEYHVQ